MRKAYLDNIRWCTVLLVMAYHVCYIYNGVGIPGGIPGAANIPACDWASGMVYPWFMALLFAVSGMSARYALEKRSIRQFLGERAKKLLVPSTLGLFAVHWITGYLNIRLGGGLDYIPPALVYPISAISGIGPLWFIQMLFLFSCLLGLLRKFDREDRLWRFCAKANIPALIGLGLVIYGGSQVLNMPVLTMYRFGIYLAAFLIGYYLLSHDGVQERLEWAWLPMLCGALAAGAAYAALYLGGDFTSPKCLQSPVTSLYLWLAVLAIIGTAKRFFDKSNGFSRYMTGASFGFYILHYPVLMLAACGLSGLGIPVGICYLLTLLAEAAGTLLAYEIIRRIPVVRWVVLGR